MAATPASPSRSLTTGGLKSPNANNAAADLIRNLDKALLSAQASSLTAKDDAERARRNARAAGEVARRYGGSSMLKKGLKKSGNADGGERSLLEMKRERRSRARMAAEARQRREYEMSGGGLGPASPRWDWGASSAGQDGDTGGAGALDVSKDPELQPRVKVPAESVGTAHYSNTPDGSTYNYDSPVHPVNLNKVVEDSNKENQQISDPVNGVVSEMSANAHEVSEREDEIYRGVSNETMSTTDGTVSTVDFEDALDTHSVEKDHDGSNFEEATATDASNNASYCNQQAQTSDSNSAYYNQQYYDQQEQYFGQQQQQQDGQNYYQSTGEQQNYYTQDGSQQYAEQSSWNMKSVATPTHANKSVPATATLTANNPLEASNAEDVLTLSLELERVRGQLSTTTQHLTTSQSHIATLQSHNAHLQSELNRLHSELESVRERSESELHNFQSKYNSEVVRANAAEEDATIALDLAKDATSAKEECEEWLNRSMEEIQLWKGRCGELERELASYRNQRSPMQNEDEPKKVRWEDESPASPVVSEDIGHHHQSPSGRAIPPPPPPPPVESSSNGAWSTPQTTPSKSSIASGRAFLYRASPGPSPYKAQVQDLLKRTAETRRILQERRNTPTKPPPSLALIAMPRIASSRSLSVLNEDGFASRQGAACRSVGKAIRDSGVRLELEGKWFGSVKTLTDGSSQPEPVIEGVAELESMVREYCSNVESKIGSQNEKIEELLAFCDHLEKELMNVK
jgi:hypothetical protein